MAPCNETIEIDRPNRDVLALFGDPLRLPEWAIEFCQSVEKVDGGFLAQTVEGPRYVDTRVDPDTGVTDICTGASPGVLDDILFLRATPLGPDRTHVSAIWLPKPEMPAEVVAMATEGLKKELEHSKRLLELSGAKA